MYSNLEKVGAVEMEKQVPKRTEKKSLERISARNLQQQFRLALSARNWTPHVTKFVYTAVKVETHSCRHATKPANKEKNQNPKCIPCKFTSKY
ncbi:hypothetical protein RUM43_005097 [Polyplax serrata]|uniref:Uncharacterized protein n=1 Tax=Polyplax serrata TaxID=468196 RepID=A0AAN8XR47_POLSC